MSFYGEEESYYGEEPYYGGGGGEEESYYGGEEPYYGGEEEPYYGGEEFGENDLQYTDSFSDTQRTSSQSSLLEAKHKYFVIVLNKFVNETNYINDSDKEQILNTLSSNVVQHIDYLNPKMMVLGWLVIKDRQIDTSQGSFFRKIIKNDKDIVIDDVIRYANFIIEKIFNK